MMIFVMLMCWYTPDLSGGGGRREDTWEIYAIFVSNVLETLLVLSEERLMPAFVQR